MLVERLAAWRQRVIRAELTLAAAMLGVLAVSLILQVLFRYVLARPLSWSEELARFLFVWVSLLGGAAYVSGSGAQSVDLLVRRFPDALRNAVAAVIRAALIVFCLMLVARGWELTEIVHMQRSPVLGVRMSLVYAAVPVAGALMAMALTLQWVEDRLRPARHPAEGGSEGGAAVGNGVHGR